jgi:RND family efflux transporter MFP subunit
LVDEEGFPHVGIVNFLDNRVDPSTGTLQVRGVFRNRNHSLSPGLFVRVRLPVGEPYKALLVSEEALGTDQGQKFVYVVDDDNRAQYRRVQVGKLQNGLRVILEGLQDGERVVVNGLQRVRPGAIVQAKMAEATARAGGEPASVAGTRGSEDVSHN